MTPPREAFRNILLLSGGSKVATARIAKTAAQKRGATLHISDTSESVPCRRVADQFSLLPAPTHSTWTDALTELCISAKIGLVIPTRHSELEALAQAVDKLAHSGTVTALSSSQALHTCIHKLDTYNFLMGSGIPTPKSCLASDFENQLEFPIIAKPESGSSSAGVIQANTPQDLESVPKDWILQEKASGKEYTTNLYVDTFGEVLCSIPHERIAVEAGEVVQAKTRRIPKLIETCRQAATQLGGTKGIINIQAFYEETTDQVSIIEINPRIGGGYPLCDAAKGRYIEWLCREYLDHEKLQAFDSWTDDLLMMRYRESFFSL